MAEDLVMNEIAMLSSAGGRTLHVRHAPAADLRTLVDECHVDVVIMASEYGFSPLGTASEYLSEALDVPVEEIKRLADWNRFNNEQVTLVAIRSRREGSSLKGLILAPAETSRCYGAFATPLYGRPHRDFYYNVTHEAVAYPATRWSAQKVGITHLSASGRFHPDIATCNAEAAAHVGGGSERSIESLVYCGCCISGEALQSIQRLVQPLANQVHRPITTSIERVAQIELIHLCWTK